MLAAYWPRLPEASLTSAVLVRALSHVALDVHLTVICISISIITVMIIDALLQPALSVPRGGEAEPQARVTYPVGHPDGIVHFIGGAFVGAAPQTSYKCDDFSPS